MNSFSFQILYQSKKSRARVGRIITPHGIIDTPNFVAVGTNAAIKAIDSVLFEQLGAQIIFCNTYHLIVQPGVEVIKQTGGLHHFMNRKGPIITDSGGFQLFSLLYGGVTEELKSKGGSKRDGMVIKLTEEGALFRSYRNGEKIFLTPETSLAAQKDLGADLIVAFDELPPYHFTQEKLAASLARTHRWEKRSLDAHRADSRGQALYAVVHGGIDKGMRKQSIEYLRGLDFEGYAIGGSLGKNREEMLEMLTYLMPQLPEDKPNHLLGIADLPSLHQLIHLGIDTFDSSYPTKAARHGLLFTKHGNLKILNSGNSTKYVAPDSECQCSTCRNYTIAYLHHLFKAHELTAYTLTSIHNIHFMVQTMAEFRAKIMRDEI